MRLAVWVALAAAAPASAQSAAEGAAEPGDRGAFRWTGGPSVRLGDAFRLDLHVKAKSDIGLRDERVGADTGFTWRNRRVSVDGELFDRVGFQVERELQGAEPWRDVYVDVRLHRALRVRAGRFKIPFSQERTTSAFDLDFIDRAASVAELAPGRENGVMAHGRAMDRLLEYEVGLFRQADWPVDPVIAPSPTPPSLVAGRVTVEPVRRGTNRAPRTLRLGVAVTHSQLAQGMHDSARHFSRLDRLPSEEYYVNGRRRRYGVEGLGRVGRLSVAGEVLRQADSRLGEAATNGDLSDLVVDGASVSGVWRVVGGVNQSRHAVDVAARFDRLTFTSADRTEEPSTSPRANHIAPMRKDTWTIGASWFVNRWVKFQVNAIREQSSDPLHVRDDVLPAATWRSLMGVQFAM
jgi:phosphate-selective porin